MTDSTQEKILVDIKHIPFEGEVRVALIPGNLPGKSILSDSLNKKFNLLQKHINDKIIDTYIEDFIGKIKVLSKRIPRVDIIVFSEYAYPISSKGKVGNSLDSDICDICQKNNIHVIAGTYQDKETNYGVTPIFTPWLKEPIVIKKWTRAIALDETIFRGDNILNLVHSHFGYYASMACLDIKDKNFQAKVGRHINNNINKNRTLDILVNPSYDPSGRIYAKGKNLSKSLQFVCLHVNELNASRVKNNPPTAVFYLDDELKSKKISYKNKKDDYIYLYEFNMRRLFQDRGKNPITYKVND